MIPNIVTLHLRPRNHRTFMPKQIYDVVVIGTGAGGGMAIKTLCEAGLKVCALNSGRRLDPEKDFRNHRNSWEMKYRGFGDPSTRMKDMPDFLDSEYNPGAWEHDVAYTVAPARSGCGRVVPPSVGRRIFGEEVLRVSVISTSGLPRSTAMT
jgi:choline dehydrogenase-like flavoprotein